MMLYSCTHMTTVGVRGIYWIAVTLYVHRVPLAGADVPGQVVLDHSTIVFDGTKMAVLVAAITAVVILLVLFCFQFADWFKSVTYCILLTSKDKRRCVCHFLLNTSCLLAYLLTYLYINEVF